METINFIAQIVGYITIISVFISFIVWLDNKYDL